VNSAHLPSTCTLNLGSVLKFPLYSLCFLSILQGIVCPPSIYLSSVILRRWCTLTFFASRAAGIYLGLSINPISLSLSSPLDFLKHSIELFGSLGPFTNSLKFNENAFLCGGGLAHSQIVLSSTYSGVSSVAVRVLYLSLLLLLFC